MYQIVGTEYCVGFPWSLVGGQLSRIAGNMLAVDFIFIKSTASIDYFCILLIKL